MNGRRKLFVWIFAGLILLTGNVLIYGKEQVIANGRTVYLRLAPVDPRSLVQGDYMALRYAHPFSFEIPDSGSLVVRLDERDIGSIVRIHDPGVALGSDEHLMRFRRGQGFRAVDIGAQSFFFEEGTGSRYAAAAYGELRLASDGAVVLVALRDSQLNLLGDVYR